MQNRRPKGDFVRDPHWNNLNSVYYSNTITNLTVPDNIRVIDWMPQNDPIGHPNMKLFITHCGMNSYIEAVYQGWCMYFMCYMFECYGYVTHRNLEQYMFIAIVCLMLFQCLNQRNDCSRIPRQWVASVSSWVYPQRCTWFTSQWQLSRHSTVFSRKQSYGSYDIRTISRHLIL